MTTYPRRTDSLSVVVDTVELGAAMQEHRFAFGSHRRPAAKYTPKGHNMKTKFVLLALTVGTVTAAAFLTLRMHAQDAPRKIEIAARRFSYDPSNITVKKGQPVVLVIKSLDVAHGLRFRELNLNAKVDKGGTAEMQFTPDKTGDFVGHCSVFCGSGHGEMTLTLHVVN
jgi:cytochrome c oxidase subunit 2